MDYREDERRWKRIQDLLAAEASGKAVNPAVSQRTLFGIPSTVEQAIERIVAGVKEFRDRIDSAGARQPVLSFNCILNYQYGKLEGRKTPPYTGPVTFGEVAYQLLNQTLVYCEILG